MNSKWVVRSLLIVTLLVAGLWVYDNYLSPFPATGDVAQALVSGDLVIVHNDDNLEFEPQAVVDKGLILYTGARVDPEAYANVARGVAEGGVLVVVVKHPLNYPILGVSAAEDVIQAHPDITSWYIGGHSLGGAMAAEFAQSNQRIAGLVLMGAFPGDSANLSLRNLGTLVIYGSEDGLATPDEVEEKAASRLPDSAEFHEIVGGNHAQFGSYGSQDGDGLASITAADQQGSTITAILRFMRP